MKIPEFTAEASLYRTSNRYRSLAFDRASPQRTVLVPQLGGPGFEGKQNCIADCIDQHPDWTRERCSAACRDPGGTSPGPRVGYGPSCDASPPAECALYLVGCCFFIPFGGVICLPICKDYYEICLENSRRECLIAHHGPLGGGSSYPRSGVIHKDVDFPFRVT